MRVVLIGGGGHASDVLGAFEAAAGQAGHPFPVIGVVADEEPPPTRFVGRAVPYLGPLLAIPETGATHYVLAVGWPRVRVELARRVEHHDLAAFSIIDPRAAIGHGVEVGTGSVVLDGAHLSATAVLGEHVYVGYQAAVGHDSVVGEFTSVMPGAMVSGNCQLGCQVLLGTNATVIEGISIGDGATVGAGAVVVRDVPADVTVVGNPAAPIRG